MESSNSTSKSSPTSSTYTVKQPESTGKTSVESKASSSRDRSSEKRSPLSKWKTQQHAPMAVPETANGNLDTIEEREFEQEITPTIITAERAAAAKIFLETYYNELLAKPSQREMRLRLLESDLWKMGAAIPPAGKDQLRRQFFCNETNHLRRTRVMKGRTAKALAEGNGGTSSCFHDYQPIKALGKGSFGVVRLVRERSKPGDDPTSRRVFAMKVIRKSGMLRTSQEGHLRAERDFLVASEGSRWQATSKSPSCCGADTCLSGLFL